MKPVSFITLVTIYASYSFAQDPSITETGIVTIQPVTPIIPSSSLTTRTSTRLGGSQVEPSSFSTSRLTISDVSTDRPTPTTTNSSSGVTTVPSASVISPPSGSTTASGSSAVSSPATTSNAAVRRFPASSIGFFGALAALSGATLL